MSSAATVHSAPYAARLVLQLLLTNLLGQSLSIAGESVVSAQADKLAHALLRWHDSSHAAAGAQIVRIFGRTEPVKLADLAGELVGPLRPDFVT